MDGETPSWLEEGESTDPPPPVPPPTKPDASNATAPAAGSARDAPAIDNVSGSILASMTSMRDKSNAPPAAAPAATTAEGGDKEELSKLIVFMRALNMAAAALLITTSIIQMVGIPAISVWVLAIYATCGGLLVCCLETQLKFIRTVIAINFGFLFHSVYRMLFYCLMASVCWTYEGILGRATAIVLGCVAVFNTYVLCRYPSYRKMREDIAAEEDKRIQAKINQQVRKQAISNMGWGRN
ncbi:hypothetical protein ACHAXA_007927 [Cyclostephanos tholiformis]|uniref:Golgi apparatus membrane protein TVP15 n=1 Tax=Cyclostephanos tholiformis TaxID=382380 RepID=A0ABD3R6I9_9STRA